MGKIQEVYKINFGSQRLLKIRFTQKLLQDISEEQDQWDVIYQEHYRAHRGIEENKVQILRKFYFPQLNKKLREFTKNCQLCQKNKYDRNPIHYPIQKTPIPTAPFEIAPIDIMFIEKFIFLTSVDKFSKHGQALLLQSRAAVDVVPAVKQALPKFKLPNLVVMDNEKLFLTGDLVNFFNAHNIVTYIAAVGRSEMNGIVERFHSTIQEIYRITKAENPTKKPNELFEISLIKYNSTIHSCTKYSPNEIIISSSHSSHIINTVYQNLCKKQSKNLEYYNRKLVESAIEPKDAYEKTRRKLKTIPRYRKITIRDINNSTITTADERRVHKNDLKIP